MWVQIQGFSPEAKGCYRFGGRVYGVGCFFGFKRSKERLGGFSQGFDVCCCTFVFSESSQPLSYSWRLWTSLG